MNYEQKNMLQKSSILTQFPAVWIGIWNVLLQSTDLPGHETKHIEK